MMQRFFALALVATFLFALPAQAGTFQHFWFADQQEYTLKCPAHYECSLDLEPGETIEDGFSADVASWDPHDTYNGAGANRVPHLIFRPAKSGLRTNVVLTTDRRTYYLLLVSTADTDPQYYGFRYQRPGVGVVSAAGVPTPAPTAAPVDLSRVNLADVCNRDRYAVDATPDEWRPETVCNDGHHTYIQLAPYHVAPNDSPILHAMYYDTAGTLRDQVVNYTAYMNLGRIVVDGVYDHMVMLAGNARMRIDHTASDQTLLPVPGVAAAPVGTNGSVPTLIAPTGSQQFVGGRALVPPDLLGQYNPNPGCPNPNAPGASPMDGSNTQTARNTKYVLQGVDAIVTYNAIKHGAVSRGLFSGLAKNLVFSFLGQAVEDWLADRALKRACPRYQNALNAALGASAGVNALTTHP